jgi:hypothetical protein
MLAGKTKRQLEGLAGETWGRWAARTQRGRVDPAPTRIVVFGSKGRETTAGAADDARVPAALDAMQEPSLQTFGGMLRKGVRVRGARVSGYYRTRGSEPRKQWVNCDLRLRLRVGGRRKLALCEMKWRRSSIRPAARRARRTITKLARLAKRGKWRGH